MHTIAIPSQISPILRANVNHFQCNRFDLIRMQNHFPMECRYCRLQFNVIKGILKYNMHLIIFWLHHNFMVALLFTTHIPISTECYSLCYYFGRFYISTFVSIPIKGASKQRYKCLPMVNHSIVCLIYLRCRNNTIGLIMENLLT